VLVSDISTYAGWLIIRGKTCYGTPASLLRLHSQHLRYWANGLPARASDALRRIADELDLVREWAEENQPRDESPKTYPVYLTRPPDHSSD
jgi:hypothetical protein